MPNVLIAPSQAKIIFDSLVGGSSTQSTLLSSSQITYNGVGEINIASYVTSGTERLSVDGVNGRLFTVSDIASGSIFSVNDISGLPIIDVNTGATDIIKIGTYGTNALVVNDTKVGIGTATPSQALQIVGSQTTSGVIYATLGTAATSTTTGSLIVTGGVGISGGFYAGTTSYFAQGALLTFAANTSGKLLNIGGNTYSGSSTTSSIYTSNGNLHIDAAATGSAGQAIYLNYHGGTQGIAFCGGTSAAVAWMGPDGDLWKGSADNTGNQYYHTGNDAGLTHLAGTETLSGAKTFSAITTISNTTVSSSTSTGALIVNGGLGVAGAVNIGGIASGLTATVNTNTTQLATTAFVLAQAASAAPLVNGIAAVGVSTKFAREDHVHPPDPGIASDLLIVHLAGTETITGAKTFSGLLTNTSGRLKNISVKTANYTLISTDHIIVADSVTTFTLTLPAASSNSSREYIIKNKGTATVTIDATALGLIDGQNTTTIPQYSAMTVVSDGTTWNIL